MTPSAEFLINKITEAISYSGSESEVSVYETIMALEIVKFNLMHKFHHRCPRCAQAEVCSHCGHKAD